MDTENNNEIYQIAEKFSSDFNYSFNESVIILSAGHGKRIKSKKSKMLHNIWGVPTVERVYNASIKGIVNINSVLVVGIKAVDVINVIGKRQNTLFAFQSEQKGTGHAVKVGLEKIDEKKFNGIIYVLPGDMGLLNSETLKEFRSKFIESKSDMMVLTGIYEGNSEQNTYGRIIRVKEFDCNGNSSGSDFGNVLEIIEYKDILAISDSSPYKVSYRGKDYEYSKKELIENREFNSGVYAFKFKKLNQFINYISSNNAQNEIYITDLISIFNKNNLSVSAISPKEQYVVMGFNDKSVLREMEEIYRQKIYDRIKNIIKIDDPEDFFIDETVVDEIVKLDNPSNPPDIRIGKGVYIGKGVMLNYNVQLKKNVFITGNVKFGTNVVVWENVHLSCFENQQFIIGNNVEILWNNIIKGNIIIGENSKIESSVNMTGSDDYPLRIGKNVLIKGTSYIFGCVIDDDVKIEHSVLIKKKIHRIIKLNGEVQSIRFYLPTPSGVDSIEAID